MSYLEKIRYLKNKYSINSRKLSILLDISKERLMQIESGFIDLSYREKTIIDRALKIRKSVSKPIESEELIKEQLDVISNLGNKITTTENEYSVKDLIIESMYYGMMLANNNKDDFILKKVRNRRR